MLAGPVAGNGNFLNWRFPFPLYVPKLVKVVTDKPFQTYEQLVTKLRDDKKLTILPEDEEHVVQLLKKYSYFSLVSGYKKLFKASDGNYRPGATIDDIFALYQFDDVLRDIFFHAIQIVEKNIKSLLSYSFVKEYGEEQSAYLLQGNYVTLPGTRDEMTRTKEIGDLIHKFQDIITPPAKINYIKHQWDKHNNVPLWVSLKAMTLGSTSKMFSLCTSKVQSDVAKEFTGVADDALAGMLDMLTRVRNVCAHNERLYDFSVPRRRTIHDMPVHAAIGISKDHAGVYKKGKTDLFAALVCLKYLLNAEELQRTVSDISAALEALSAGTKVIPPNKILAEMGFPSNWADIAK